MASEERQHEAPTEAVAFQTNQRVKRKWYRSTFYNALVLGMCNFLAPGIWGAMNSLGGGGEEQPYLVNTANALTFCLMVVTCFGSSMVVRLIGIRNALIFGTIGFVIYAAGLYANNRFGSHWFVLFGAACCGVSAGIFWMAEAAIALSYPEAYNQGRFLGFWLSFRLGGQVLGGAINLALNVDDSHAGKVSYKVYIAFIALQALAPFVGLLLNKPHQVQRTDGIKVSLAITDSTWAELKATFKMFFSPEFLMVMPLMVQADYTEAVMFTFLSLWYSVRARALGSFLSGIVSIIAGNILGYFLDRNKVSLRSRARWGFSILLAFQGACWIWATILVTDYRKSKPTYDWNSPGFGKGFALFLFWNMGFQLNYVFLYFLIGNLAKSEAEVVRLAGLLRGTEAASQALSYGLNAIPLFAEVGGVYLNFSLWGVSLLPGWMVVKGIGASLGDRKLERELANMASPKAEVLELEYHNREVPMDGKVEAGLTPKSHISATGKE